MPTTRWEHNCIILWSGTPTYWLFAQTWGRVEDALTLLTFTGGLDSLKGTPGKNQTPAHLSGSTVLSCIEQLWVFTQVTWVFCTQVSQVQTVDTAAPESERTRGVCGVSHVRNSTKSGKWPAMTTSSSTSATPLGSWGLSLLKNSRVSGLSALRPTCWGCTLAPRSALRMLLGRAPLWVGVCTPHQLGSATHKAPSWLESWLYQLATGCRQSIDTRGSTPAETNWVLFPIHSSHMPNLTAGISAKMQIFNVMSVALNDVINEVNVAP